MVCPVTIHEYILDEFDTYHQDQEHFMSGLYGWASLVNCPQIVECDLLLISIVKYMIYDMLLNTPQTTEIRYYLLVHALTGTIRVY
jgi:hypothetical protein